MIYLFNSAYRDLYQENLLSTLFLPSGWVNEYRYRCSPERRNVSETFSKEVKKIEGKEDAVIIFINRFGKDANNKNAYEYYPLRTALFLSCGEEYQQLYVRVKLLDFIYPNDIDSFSKQLIDKLSPLSIPQLQDNNPKEENDGYYAIHTDSILNDRSIFKFGENAWADCVNAISSTECLKSSIDKQLLFGKVELWEHSPKYKNIRPRISNNPWYRRPLKKVNDGDSSYRVTTNRRYGFHINYVYPIQGQDTAATAKLILDISNNIVPRTSQELPINSRASRIIFPFTFREPVQDRFATIAFKFSPSSGATNLIASTRSYSFEIEYSKGYWAGIIILVILFAITSIIIGIDLSKVDFANIGDYLINNWNWTKLLAPISQAFVLFLLFKLTGKRFL